MMQDVSFKRAPLIEIVAELRWLPAGVPQAPAGQLQISIGGADPDAFLLTFGRHPDVGSFSVAEKLVPAGFPPVWHQVVWRFRDPTTPAALLQVGPGIFTANALQPYKRWSDFRPTVERGIKALLVSRPAQEQTQPFTGLTLRYINAFTPELAGGSVPAFVRDVLGFGVEPPQPLANLAGGQVGSMSVNLLIPVANTSKRISVQVGDGTVRPAGMSTDTPVVMLDLAVSESVPTIPNIEEVMSSFDRSRDLIHNAFLAMTAAIHDKMEPVHDSTT